MNLSLCPCGSNKSYSECCAPLHLGQSKAKTAEQLMRSRYCAFCKCKVEYLIQTHLPENVHPNLFSEILNWASSTHFTKLTILHKTKGTQKDLEGTVEFIAEFEDSQGKHQHHEKSHFEKIDNTWFYTSSIT